MNNMADTTTEKITSYSGEDGFDEKTILDKINSRYRSISGEFAKEDKRTDENRKWWSNSFTDEERQSFFDVKAGEEPTEVPKIFENIESIIPIVTQKTPEPEIKVVSADGYGSKKKAYQLKTITVDFLKQLWEMDLYMQKKEEQGMRNYFCQRFVAYKYLYNPVNKTYECYVIPMKKLKFSKEGNDENSVACIMEDVSNNFGKLSKLFPDKVDAMNLAAGKVLKDEDVVNYIEYWENEYVAWKYKDVLLGAYRNPNWNWEGENHFDAPQKPYVIESALGFGDKIIDDVTPIDVAKSLAKSINKRKRQIDLNLDDANGQLVVAGNAMSQEDLDAIDRSKQNKIRLEGQDGVNDKLTYISGRGFTNEGDNDMSHSESHVDNIFKTHNVTRGEQQTQETATGRQIMKDSDITGLSLYTRMNERVAQKLYNAFIQLVFVYGDNKYSLFNQKADATQQQSVSKETFKGFKIRVLVKDGSTVPRNPAVVKAEAVDLGKAKMMALVDMYKIMEYPNPEELAKNAIMEQTDPNKLYNLDGNNDVFNTQAIHTLYMIQTGQIDGTDPANMYHVEDINMMTSYLNVMTRYLAGELEDENLTPFMELDPIFQSDIQAHVQLELDEVKKMQMQQQQQTILEKKLQLAGDPMPPMDGMNTNGQQPPMQAPQGQGVSLTATAPLQQ